MIDDDDDDAPLSHNCRSSRLSKMTIELYDLDDLNDTWDSRTTFLARTYRTPPLYTPSASSWLFDTYLQAQVFVSWLLCFRCIA